MGTSQSMVAIFLLNSTVSRLFSSD
jgi:hypothetical protein